MGVINPGGGSGSGNVTGPGSSTDRAIATWNGTGGATLFDNPGAKIDSTGQLKPTAGTTTVAPVILATGTLNTTAQIGAEEFDGTVFYDSLAASTRAARVDVQYTILNANYTVASQTAAQKLFNASTNGAVTLPVGEYRFRCYFAATGLSGTPGSFGFALGGAATFTQAWTALADKKTISLTNTTLAGLNSSFNTAANTALTAANANGNALAYVEGVIKVTVAGTVIPQISLGQAAAAVVQAGSFFEVWAVNPSATGTTVGNWS